MNKRKKKISISQLTWEKAILINIFFYICIYRWPVMFMRFTVFWTLNWTCLWMNWMFTGFFFVVVVLCCRCDAFCWCGGPVVFIKQFTILWWNQWHFFFHWFYSPEMADILTGSWFPFDYIILTSWWNGIIVPQFMFSCCHSMRQQSLL